MKKINGIINFGVMALAFLAISFLATPSFAVATLAPVELALDWKPEPEFGGFYAAKLNKEYEKAGIDLSILPGGAGQPVSQMVAAKKVKFGIAAGDEVILARSQGQKIVAIYAVYQNDPQGFMVHAERPIHSLKELFQSEGTIALQKGLPYTLWFDHEYQPYRAKIVPYTGGITSFVQGKDFSQQCFVTSEPILARKERQKINTFLISESGYNPYETVVVVHEDTLKNEPDLVKKFVQATRAGWAEYLSKPEGTNVEMQKLNSSLDLATFNEAAKLQTPFVQTAETGSVNLGMMTMARWSRIYEQMLTTKLAKPGLEPSQFFLK